MTPPQPDAVAGWVPERSGDAARRGQETARAPRHAGPMVSQAHRIGRGLPRHKEGAMLDAFKTNGSSPPQRARTIRYRRRTVTLKLNEPPAQKLSDPTRPLPFFRPSLSPLDPPPADFATPA